MNLSKTLANCFGFTEVKIEAIGLGEENSTYAVILPQTQFVLRVYSQKHSMTGQRNREQVEQELRFIEHLADNGVPTPRSIKNKLGEAVSVGPNNQFFALFEHADGEHPTRYLSLIHI